jgi:hypothetical protein
VSTPARLVAVALDGDPTPAWQQRALSGLLACDALEVAEVSLTGPPRRSRVRSVHAAVERRLLGLGPDALAPTAVDRSLIDGPAGRRATKTDSEQPPVDLLVWLSEAPPPEDEPRDVLYFCHAGVAEPGERASLRALLSGASSLQSELLLRRADRVVIVERTVSGLRPFSLTLSRDLLLWKLAALLPRAVERALGEDLSRSVVAAPSVSARAPSAQSTLALLARSAIAWPRIVLTRLLFRRPWSIRVRRRGPEPTEGWSGGEEELVRWTGGSMYADPFLFEHEGRHHLFCEELPFGARRGVISHTELRLDGSPAEAPRPVLARPHHLSYPFVFVHDGQVFMIPETSAVARVELYRAVEFPDRWEREAVLIDELDAADATLLAHGDRLWMFAAVTPPDASSLDELHLFWASELRGPWRSHPRNPVVSDVRCARPAGAVQRWGSRLVRPGQDGSRRYGGSISFREIDVLTPDAYAEHEIARLDPTDLGDARATHTYSADARFEAIDLRRREPRSTFAARARRERRGRRGGR